MVNRIKSYLLFLSALILIPVSPLAAKPNPAKFKIGAILPLSGRAADYGVAARNGIELAKKDYPELFKSIDFTFDDSLYDGKTTITSFHKMVSSEGADMMFVWGHGPCEAVAPVAESNKVPTIVISGDYTVARNKEHVIRFFNIHEEFGLALLKYLRKQGYKRLGVIKAELGFLNHVVNGIKNNLKPDESLELVDNFQTDATDFKTSILKLKNKKFDAVGVFLSEEQVSLFFRQADSLYFKAPTFGSHSFASKSSIFDAKGSMTGAVYPAIPVSTEFQKKYMATYDNDVQISFAANAYDFALLIGNHFNKLKEKPTADFILNTLKSITNYKGVSGKYGFEQSPAAGGGFKFEISIRQIQEDNSVKVADSGY